MIFSFCQIKQFSEITDCLHDEIIVFVNKIVQIIHGCANKWDGQPTNNNGERYVLTWKLPTGEHVKKESDVIRGENGTPQDEANIQITNDFKSPRPDAPWIKEEPEEFEDL